MLLEAGQKGLSEAGYLSFSQDVLTLARNRLQQLRVNVTEFCRSFDHENAGKPLRPEAKNSVEDTVAFLSGDLI